MTTLPAHRRELLARLRQPVAATGGGGTPSTIELTPATAGPPLFLVPAVSGSPYAYLGLRGVLPPTQPVATFEAPGLSGGEPLTTIPDIAAHYLDQIRRRWPDGPYLLGGWSFGATVAFEIAQRLRGQGAEVAMLALIDGAIPGVYGEPSEDEVGMAFARDLAGYGVTPGALPAGVRDQRYQVFRANMRAYRAYRASRWEGSATVIRAVASTEPWAGWCGWCGRLTVRTVPGDHYSMWDADRLPALATALTEAILTVVS